MGTGDHPGAYHGGDHLVQVGDGGGRDLRGGEGEHPADCKIVAAECVCHHRTCGDLCL